MLMITITIRSLGTILCESCAGFNGFSVGIVHFNARTWHTANREQRERESAWFKWSRAQCTVHYYGSKERLPAWSRRESEREGMR